MTIQNAKHPKHAEPLDIPGDATASDADAAPSGDPAAPTPAPARDAVEGPFVRAKFEGLVLVCGQCEQRGSGPSRLTAKDARKSLKQALGAQRARMRIVQSSCLGLCPKKALAIAAAAQGAPSMLAAARNERDLKAVAERLATTRNDG